MLSNSRYWQEARTKFFFSLEVSLSLRPLFFPDPSQTTSAIYLKGLKNSQSFLLTPIGACICRGLYDALPIFSASFAATLAFFYQLFYLLAAVQFTRTFFSLSILSCCAALL